ncbi:RDD family protein [Saxibacter everestensis]|uniref:RDD family protein n=1 Tax=Saxibacter everestensis TaxID=2909229 RepID=A0ABY8QP13_9MICO|nr:RDD family protein [Brevibacteriaceae bacterium ZFBP1038]
MSTVVTGEAVALDLKPASIAMRGLGTLIDFVAINLVYIGLIIATAWVLDRAAADSSSLLGAFALGYYVLVYVAIPVTVETLTRGKSLGKLAVGLRVVREDGGSIRFRHALIRGMLWQVEVAAVFGGVAALVGLVSHRSKRVGDYLAGTYALSDRAARNKVQLSVMPPRLTQWAATADIRSLPDDLGARISQFLSNAPRLNPGARMALAVSLAEQVNRYAAPAPPPGTYPEEFLAAVCTVRRDRDFERLARQARELQRHDEALHRLPFRMDEYDPERNYGANGYPQTTREVSY